MDLSAVYHYPTQPTTVNRFAFPTMLNDHQSNLDGAVNLKQSKQTNGVGLGFPCAQPKVESDIYGAHASSSSLNGGKKQEDRLLRNRSAAKECRLKKKEYVKCLEKRLRVLEDQNKQLIEQVKTLMQIIRNTASLAATANHAGGAGVDCSGPTTHGVNVRFNTKF